MDAVRPDHLSCYGYDRIKTEGIDFIAEEGVLFENCIASSCLTPVSHASILTGKDPPTHGIRDPFCQISKRTLAEIFKMNGYNNAGFVGIDFIGTKHGFNKGFGYFEEPKEKDAWNVKEYNQKGETMNTRWGHWWVEKMLNWLKENASSPFFIWGHYFEAHFLAEKNLLYSNKIDHGELSEHAYYDAKIKYMDNNLFLPMIKTLKKFNLWEKTVIVVTSDHGEILGPLKPSWGDFYFNYPQHKTMYDSDLKVPLIIKTSSEIKCKRIKQSTRAIDIVPTLVELLNIETDDTYDGTSLIPLIKEQPMEEQPAYSEELYKERGEGALQSYRTSKFKLIRNNTNNKEEFFDLLKDPDENNNIIYSENPEHKSIIREFRGKLDKCLNGFRVQADLDEEDENKVMERLKSLGYIG